MRLTEPDTRMSRRRILQAGGAAAGAVLAGAALVEPAWARPDGDAIVAMSKAGDVDGKAITQAVGGPGQLMPGGVYVVSLSRDDLKPKAFGVSLQPDLAADGEASFMRTGDSAMAMGELALVDTEIPAVTRGLLTNGFKVSAIHNHLVPVSPLIMFVHFSGTGDAVQLAGKLRAALAGSKTPFKTKQTVKAPAIDIKGLQQVFGDKGQIEDEVISFDVPRNEKITMNGMMLPPAMGVQSYFYFQSTGGGKAAAQAEFALLASEVDTVMSAMVQSGYTVTALHNHMTMISPMLFWMHVWATGDAVTVAKAFTAALSHTNSKQA